MIISSINNYGGCRKTTTTLFQQRKHFSKIHSLQGKHLNTTRSVFDCIDRGDRGEKLEVRIQKEALGAGVTESQVLANGI